MLFTSLEFLFFFLPIVIVGYYLLPRCLRNAWLLLVSLCFYAWGEPSFVMVMVLSIVLNYIFAILIDWLQVERPKAAKVSLTVGVLLNLGLIAAYKYTNFAVSVIREVCPGLRGVVSQTSILLPIGISFFTFQSMSYLVDVFRGVKAQRNFINMALYIALFPQLIAGPIVRYHTIAEQITSRRETFSLFFSGVGRFVVGFNKKILLANSFAVVADKMFETTMPSIGGAWLGAFAYAFQIFFDFSGYSDMAIGLGRMFGFEFLENFNFPYVSKSITEFWRRWHISLGQWFRDYLYFPLGGSYVGSKTRLIYNLLVVWVATGVWHGANWTFFLWGTLYGVLIIIEKLFGIPRKMESGKLIGFGGWLVTSFFVVLGWVLFRSPNLTSACVYLSAMFGFSTFQGNDYSAIFLAGEIVYLLPIAVVVAIPHRPKMLRNPAVNYILQMLFFTGSISCLVMNSYNPFIYFNF